MAPPDSGVPPPLCFVQRGTEEWLYMWSRLRRAQGGITHRHPSSGECWQYMGTVYLDKTEMTARGAPCLAGEPPGWFHEFRHRMHPELHDRRVYWACPASYFYQLQEAFRVKQSRVNRYAT